MTRVTKVTAVMITMTTKTSYSNRKKGNNNNNGNDTATQVTIKAETISNRKNTNFKIEVLFTIKRNIKIHIYVKVVIYI